MPKFKNKAEEETAKSILKDGKKTKFWQMVVEAMEESKQFIQNELDREDLLDISAEEYKYKNELFKAKKRMIDSLIKTPDNLASWLGTPEGKRTEFDPYAK